MSHATETEELVEEYVDTEQGHSIILYNDDVNTFDHVIDSLVDICSHSVIQAEQVAWIVHTKGKCDVKRGELDLLQPLNKKLQNRGLSSVIE